VSQRIIIRFRDKSCTTLPDPRSKIISVKSYVVAYGNGIVTITDPYSVKTTYPLDLIESIEETPDPRY